MLKTNDFDLVVIGGGPGGYEAAALASEKYGMKTALVDARGLGGTCLNRGCVPTKTLLHSAEIYHDAKAHAEKLGLKGESSLTYDMAAIKARKEEVSETLTSGIAMMLKKAKVTVISGWASILDAGRVRVKMLAEDADEPEEILTAKRILIATGSQDAVLPVAGADLPGVLGSEQALALDENLDSLIIIGAGVTGTEFATVFASLGVKVTVIEAAGRIIPVIDKDMARALQQILSKNLQVEYHLSTMVKEISGEGGAGTAGMTCRCEEKGKEIEFTADYVLMCAGRRTFIDGLIDLEASDAVKAMDISDRGVIAVNDSYETSVPGIYAIGDVIGGIQLAHMATAEGRRAVTLMNGDDAGIDMSIVPSCIYSIPEIATVGIGADEAKERGLAVITKKYPMGANGKSVLSMSERGSIKIIADAETKKVLGAQLMCKNATDMIPVFAQAMVSGLTIDELAKTIYPHPTVCEAIGEALRLF